MPSSPPLVLIHGAFMNPDCWEGVATRYRAQGHTVHAPAWPHQERPAEELRASPDPRLATIGLGEIVAHMAAFVDSLPSPPILIGHSFGGLVVQLLLSQGKGAAAVAVHSAPPLGVLPGFSAIRANLPVILTPGGAKKLVTMTEEHFCWGFGNALPKEQQHDAWARYIVPTPGRPFFQLAAFDSSARVDFMKEGRAPLLLLAGGKDRTVTEGMNRSNYSKYKKNPAMTEFRAYPDRSHTSLLEPGWEEVADEALHWALQAAASR